LQKRTMEDKKRKIAILIVSILMVASAVACTIFGIIGVPVQKTITKASYNMNSEIKYDVYFVDNPIYNETYLKFGDGYVTKYINGIMLTLLYQFDSEKASDLKGNYSVSAVLEATYNEANQIWSKEYPLITEQAFSSGQTSANLSLPIRDYIQLANSIEQDTGVTTSASMTITFRVNASATIEGMPVEDTSVSTLVFDLSKDVLVMNGEPNSVQTKNVEETITENMFPKKMVFFITMPLLLSMVGCLLYLLKYTCGVREDPVKRKLKEIYKKYHSRIVELYPGETIYRKETIMVKSFQDLLLVADELNKPIFKNSTSQDTDIDFYVLDELIAYIYTNKVAEKVLL